ncbi:MAG: UDP-N-acetylmuramoyl-tripeptide--D-alanyl-D-alanine ligase [Opitutus sp.]|nr:UDP-N-acetylmuramoyl-tripeptide--D-alanyl-D-alanine ligase [Opitutus sp.]
MPTFSPEKLAAASGGRWTRSPGGALVAFNQDTRTLTAGQVFVALQTEKRDGHEFLADAAAKGAAAAVVSRAVANAPLPQLVTTDALAAFQKIAAAHRREFTGPVIGVTGSAGKTSTKDLLALLLDARPVATDPTSAGRVLKTEGNLNNFLGVPLTLTQLDPARHDYAVIEAGINEPGEMATLANMISPDHAVVTLVGPAHLEKLGSTQGVAAEKVQLLTAVRDNGLQVFPVGAWQYAPFRALKSPLVLVPANEAMVRVDGPTIIFTVLHRPDRTEVTLGAKRTFILRRVSSGMAQNAALALALASELGVPDAMLQPRLAAWAPSKWRGEMQRVGETEVYCDFYNANPASMQDAIQTFASLARPELPRLYVLGGMEELGAAAAEFHQQLGRTILLRPGDFLFTIGTHAAALREGLLENGNDPAQIAVVADLEPVRTKLATFRGVAFLKGSRRYRLETILSPEVGAH